MRAQQDTKLHWLLKNRHLMTSIPNFVPELGLSVQSPSTPDSAQGQRTSLTGTAQKELQAMLHPGISLFGGVTQCFLLYSGS